MFCTNCGKQISDDSEFCTFCGGKVIPVAKRMNENTSPETVIINPESIAPENISYEGESENSDTVLEAPAIVEAVSLTAISDDDIFELEPYERKEKSSKMRSVMLVTIAVTVVVVVACAAVIIFTSLIRNRYNGTPWYASDKKEQVEEPDLAAFDKQGSGSSIATEWEYGSQTRTMLNIVACDDDYYYIANPEDNGYLYKVNKNNTQDSSKLADISPSEVQYINGTVYMAVNNYDPQYSEGIYSISADGKNLQCIIDGQIHNLFVVNDWIYYIRGMDDSLCKINEFDRREIVFGTDIYSFFIHENNIYCEGYYETGEDEYQFMYYMMDVDGSINVVYQDWSEERYKLGYNDGYVMLARYDDSISIYNSESGELIKTIGCHPDFLRFAYYENEIYFIDLSSNNSIAVLNVDAESVLHYSINDVTEFDIVDGKLWIEYVDGTEEMLSVNDINTGDGIELF